MTRSIVFHFFFFVYLASFAQVVTTVPSLPIESEPVTIIFDATLGSGGLKDYTGDVYVHTGVITDKSTGSSDWKYVKAAWTENKPECKMTRTATNKYSLQINGSIRSFYGVPSTEKIVKMAMVFRSGDRTKEGKDVGNADIFLNVYTGAFDVSFITPDKSPLLVDKNAVVQFNVFTTQNATITLTVNGNTVFGSSGTSLAYPYTFVNPGNYEITAKAVGSTETKYDTTRVYVRSTPQILPLPQGVRDGINYIDDHTITLVLHAPDKKFVYLLGDFNNWQPDNSYQLNKADDKWWITLTNLTPGTEYGYQFLIDDGLLIADPYAEKVLDPWNDAFIPETVYPDLKPYPAGKTTGIVGVLEPGKKTYNWQTEFEKPDIQKLVIYELLIRDFIETHDIKDVEKKLGYLKSLGVNAIELMPFNEFEGNSSWGYNPSYYFAPDKYYGRAEDYKAFIDACHANGMAVIMDMVLNHAYGQNPMVQMYFENGNPAPDNPWFNVTSPNNVFSWGYDFDHESEDTKYFVDRVIEYWLKEYNVDGFRLDFTKGFTNKPGDGQAYDASRIAILKRIYDVMQQYKPGSYMICEHLADNSEEEVLSDYGMLLWGNMNYGYAETAMGWVNTSNISGVSYKQRGWSKPHLISYMESHDEERLMYKAKNFGNISSSYNIKNTATALDRMEMAAALYFTIPGPKMIWQFGEYGYDYSINFNGRVGEKPIVWNYLDNPDRDALKEVYSKLIHLKTKNSVFNTSDFSLNFGSTPVKYVKLNGDDSYVLAIANTDVTPKTTQPGFQIAGWWYDALRGDSLLVSGSDYSLTLNPGEYRVLSSRKLTTVSTKNPSAETSIKVFPNPASDVLNITSANTIKSVTILSVSGKVFLRNEVNNNEFSINTRRLDSGIYFMEILTQKGRQILPVSITH